MKFPGKRQRTQSPQHLTPRKKQRTPEPLADSVSQEETDFSSIFHWLEQHIPTTQSSPTSSDPSTVFGKEQFEYRVGNPSIATPRVLPLTQQNLRLLEKMTTRLRKTKTLRVSILSSTPFYNTGTTQTRIKEKTLSTTAPGFEARAFDNGVLNPPNSKPPVNIDDLRTRLNMPRRSSSPSETRFRAYSHAVQTAPNEDSIVHIAARLFNDFEDDPQYTQVYNQTLNLFPHNVGFNDGLSAPQPDLMEGLQQPSFQPFPIRQEIGGAAVLLDDPNSITLPHLAGEWKGRGRSMESARVQSAYDGAALVYARSRALSYIGVNDPPGHAAVITFTWDGVLINFWAHYAAPSPTKAGAIEYHQYLITSTNMLNSYADFKKGCRLLQNLQDFARERAYELRDRLREHWQQRQLESDTANTNPTLHRPNSLCEADTLGTIDETDEEMDTSEG